MRLGPSLLPAIYNGRSTRHEAAPAPGKKRLSLRIATVAIHGMERSLNTREFSRALQETVQATLSAACIDKLPIRKYQAVVSERNLKADARASEVAQRLAALMARTLDEEQSGGTR